MRCFFFPPISHSAFPLVALPLPPPPPPFPPVLPADNSNLGPSGCQTRADRSCLGCSGNLGQEADDIILTVKAEDWKGREDFRNPGDTSGQMHRVWPGAPVLHGWSQNREGAGKESSSSRVLGKTFLGSRFGEGIDGLDLAGSSRDATLDSWSAGAS